MGITEFFKNTYRRTRKKINSMTISGKLRLVSSIVLIFPLFLATVSVTIIYLTFVTGNYAEITGLLVEVDNTNYAYQAYEYIDDEFHKMLDKGGEPDITQMFLTPENKEQGIVYLQMTKNGELIYTTRSMPKPSNFEELYSSVKGVDEKVFSIIDENIIFIITAQHDGDIYEIAATGMVRSFNLSEKTSDFYVNTIIINLFFTVIVILSAHALSKYLNKIVFNRVEYSLELLSEGVEKITDGDLSYRIEYNRDDEFTPICNCFNIMAQQLQQSTETIQMQERSRKEMFMSITHDIFSPLTSIKAYVEGIQDGIAATPQAQQKYLEIIKSKAIQIEQIVTQIIHYTKLEYDEISVQKEKINLKDFLESYVEDIEAEYAFKNVQIYISRCDNVTIMGDKGNLSRLMSNLVENSHKYSDKETCHIDISLTAKENTCVLKVADDGPGVAPASIDHIFEVFYRGDAARQQKNRGCGIGLSVVHNIATKHLCGTVKAENCQTGGLAVIIEIPTVKE